MTFIFSYQAKELPSSSMSQSQKIHQSRLREASSRRRKLGFFKKNRTSVNLFWNREKNLESELVWLGKYLCRCPSSWFRLHTLQKSNSLFCFLFFFFMLFWLIGGVNSLLGLGFGFTDDFIFPGRIFKNIRKNNVSYLTPQRRGKMHRFSILCLHPSWWYRCLGSASIRLDLNLETKPNRVD